MKISRNKTKEYTNVSATGILGMGLGGFLFVYAITKIDPAKVVTITSSSPLFGMLFAAIFLKERITKRIGLGIVLCLAGVYAAFKNPKSLELYLHFNIFFTLWGICMFRY